MKQQTHYDLIIIGAGIVGAATLQQYQMKYPNKKALLIDKERKPSIHQTGRNSGVIHAGVYYPPNSLKAEYCREGLHDTIAWCQQYKLPFEQCGKLIVATNDIEMARLDVLFNNCQANELHPQRISKSKLKVLEPNITGQEAILVNATGITDYAAITHSLLDVSRQSPLVDVIYQREVVEITEYPDKVSVAIISNGTTNIKRNSPEQLSCEQLVCCAGVYADELIQKQGLKPDFKIIPFKGIYYKLADKFNGISERLIYPVPDPEMPFLGVHLTKMIGGYTTVGPNAVLALGREAYDELPSISEIGRTVSYSGLYKLLWKYRRSVFKEVVTTFSQKKYAELVQKYCPAVKASDFSFYRPGIRAQAMLKDGTLVHDFKFVQTERVLHVGNAPSPAATSAMPISRAIIKMLSA